MIRLDEVYEVYRAVPVPIISPLPLVSTDEKQSSTLIASYKLETRGFLIDKSRQFYALLSENELISCSHKDVRYCSVQSPLYTVVLGNTCVINLFLDGNYGQHCTTVVTKETLPIAYKLMANNWVIVSRESLKLVKVCNGHHTEIISSPFDVINLEDQCVATCKYFTLRSPYIAGNIHMPEQHSFDLYPANFSKSIVWDEFNYTFPEMTEIKIPDKLPEISDMPIDILVRELKSVRGNKIRDEKSYNWWFYVSLVLALVVAIIIIICCCKTQLNRIINCLPNCLRRGMTGVHKVPVRNDVELRKTGNDGKIPSAVTAPTAAATGPQSGLYPWSFLSSCKEAVREETKL
jgi:hypothetical protein